jgi:hypothetical protein
MTIAGYMASRIDSYATVEELYGSLFAEPEWWSRPNGLMYQNYTNVLYSSRPVPLSIYEININVPGGAITNSQAALTAYTPSLGAGLAVADHMLMALRELKARDQCLFSLSGYDFSAGSNWAYVWGVVRDMGVTDRKRPQYLACQLANQVLAGDMLATGHTGDDPKWTVTNLNYVTYTNAHYIQSYAFANGTNRSVIVFNLHRTDNLLVNFGGTNSPVGVVTWKQLTSSAITNNNENSVTVSNVTQTLSDYLPSQNLNLPPYSMNVLTWSAATPIQWWRVANFDTSLNTGNAADFADPDNDSLVNLLEYALGLNPNTSSVAGGPVVSRVTTNGDDYLTITATKNPNATDIQYAAEVSSDLFAWTNDVTVLQNDVSTFQARDNTPMSAAARRFIRLKITGP